MPSIRECSGPICPKGDADAGGQRMSDGTEHSTKGDGGGQKSIDRELAHSNRNLASTLGGTCVAILTFLLFFLYDREVSGEVNNYLFQSTVLCVIVALYLFALSAAEYYRGLALSRKDMPKGVKVVRRADGFLFFGLVLLVLEPALILFTIKLTDLALAASALWAVALVFMLLGGRDES